MVEQKWTQEEIASDAVGKKEIINFLNGKKLENKNRIWIWLFEYDYLM